MMVGPLENHPDRQKPNIRRQMEKIMKNETHTHLQISWNNADKWEQQPGCAVFIRSHRLSHNGTCLSCPIKFQCPLSLRQVGRSQIISRMVSLFKVKQQLSSQLFHSGIFRAYARGLEIEQNYRMDWPLTSSPIYLTNNCPDHLGNTFAGKQSAVP